MTPMWAWFGYDEPNYTYMKDGKKLLSELAAPEPRAGLRPHAQPADDRRRHRRAQVGLDQRLHRGRRGRPIYDWTIVDRIIDTYLERKMKPLVEIGFMPEALSTKPQPYRHFWKPGDNYNDIYTGWAYPPKDYAKWGELVYQWVQHSVEKYGRAEVESLVLGGVERAGHRLLEGHAGGVP